MTNPILVRERDTILSDVEHLLGDAAVTSPAKIDLVSMAIEALQVARANHERAAQALLAAALGRLIHDVLGYEKLGQAYRALAADPDEATLTEMRLVCLQLATANALTDVNRNPEGFNRHGTQHGDTTFFSTAAMLSALILVAGWVQELTWFEDRGLSIPGWS